MKTFEKLQQIKEIITQLVVITITAVNITGYYKTIAINLSKQQALDADPKAINQINFTANLDQEGNKTIFSLLK